MNLLSQFFYAMVVIGSLSMVCDGGGRGGVRRALAGRWQGVGRALGGRWLHKRTPRACYCLSEPRARLVKGVGGWCGLGLGV